MLVRISRLQPVNIKTGGDILSLWKADGQCHLLDLQENAYT